MPDAITASNALTARWAATCDGTSSVLSGLGVWPLLALLVDAADGPARSELAVAAGTGTGTGTEQGADAARGLVDLLGEAPAIHAALGLWTHRDLPLNEPWVRSLPDATHELLSGDLVADKDALDAWASKHTNELIRKMPVTLTADVLLVLASALAVRTTWPKAFTDGPHRVAAGPWAGRTIAALSRTSPDVDQVAVTATDNGPLTTVRVAGSDDIDVHLLLGEPNRSAGDIITAGIRAVTEPAPLSTGAQWAPGDWPGPGIAIRHSASLARPSLLLHACRFTVRASHDLLKRAELFGLRSATDTSRGHFPGISPQPLAISQARQDAVAIFSATGFEAAAVTAISMVASGMVRAEGATLVEVTFDRPFGFLAVHRPSRLVLVAGWVAEPEPA